MSELVEGIDPGIGEKIGERLNAVAARVVEATRRSGRSDHAVTVVAVSKTVDVEVVRAAYQLGWRQFGENRAQDLVAKANALADDCVWHMIGPVQSNKVRMLAPVVGLWHTIDRISLADELARRCQNAEVLIEVNLGGEPQKAGCRLTELDSLLDHSRSLGLRTCGLMCIPPAELDPRRYFEQLRQLGEARQLPELSMGMSDDFEIAIDCGATIVRVGTAIFGPRPGVAHARN